jgi:V-type H+-transporting ATPase proteolipid subunit
MGYTSYYAFGLPTFLVVIIALYILFTGVSALFISDCGNLMNKETDSGEAFNVGKFLEESSPFVWGSIGVGFCIGLSVLGAGWCVPSWRGMRPS